MWLIGGLGAAYIGIMLFMYLFQHHLVFHPSKNLHMDPGDLGIAYEEVAIVTKDSVTLHGWFIPAEDRERVIILFHGNAGNIADRVFFVSSLRRLGIPILIFDYRGFGRSEGTPGEAELYSDGRAAWRYLTEEKGFSPEKIILFGRSLGSAVATKLAVEKSAGAVILDAPFTSGVDLGSDIYPWLPVRLLMKYKFNNAGRIAKIDVPVLIAHSRSDRVVPYHHGKRLFDLASEPKLFVDLDGHHGAGFDEQGDYLNRLRDFIGRHVPAEKPQ